MARKKKDFFSTQSISFTDGEDREHFIDLLKRYWIPLLEQMLNQARRLLEKLERGQ
ncbi:MAG: hypothetical protein JXM69_17935 [Anaerolineae bacterium]|nr:hypothetical protein [Anaerolineae bacterium]